MLVLGIDQSLRHSGVFWLSDAERGFRQIDTDGQRGANRLLYIKSEILKIVDEKKPTLVALEGYSYGSVGRLAELGELGGVLKVAMFERAIPTIVVAPIQLKKFVTGCTSADKQDIVDRMNQRFGFNWALKDNNIADAAALACVAQAYLAPDAITSRSQAEVIMALKNVDAPPQKKIARRKKLHNI